MRRIELSAEDQLFSVINYTLMSGELKRRLINDLARIVDAKKKPVRVLMLLPKGTDQDLMFCTFKDHFNKVEIRNLGQQCPTRAHSRSMELCRGTPRVTAVFCSYEPGNGKTFQINQQIRRLGGRKYQIMISGELDVASIESKFKPLIGRSGIEHLYIKVEFLINLNRFKHFLNDFLFRLCHSRYLHIQGEHHFLDPDVRVWIEVATYHSNLLFDQLSFLRCLEKTQCAFDLEAFEFDSDPLSDEQIVGSTLSRIVRSRSRRFLNYGRYIRGRIEQTSAVDVFERFPTVGQVHKWVAGTRVTQGRASAWTRPFRRTRP